MIPLKDNQPTRRTPVVTFALIAANVLVFLWQVGNPLGFDWTVGAYGVVPYEVWTLTDIAPSGRVPPPFTVLSSMFLHGGVGHLVFNMLFLWVFGNNVEDALGRGRFLLFYLLTGAAAAGAQILLTGPERVPMVGASGAIAGILGGYFVLFPRAQVLTVVPIFIFLHFIWLPAFVFLMVWFAVQLLSSAGGGSVAWYAHIGGFLAGLVLVRLFGGVPAEVRPAWRARRYRWS